MSDDGIGTIGRFTRSHAGSASAVAVHVHIETPWLRELAGVSLENVEAQIPGTKLRERGALLITHWGLSGPAILRLSAWGARELHEKIIAHASNQLAAAFERGKAAGGIPIAPPIARRKTDFQFARRTTARATLGATCNCIWRRERHTLVGISTTSTAQIDPAIASR